MEQAQRDLLIHSAQDSAFRRLAQWYGFTYQQGFEEGSWRRALKELAYGRRGSKRTTFDVVRHTLRQYDEVFRVKINRAYPAALQFVAGVTDTDLTAFERRHVNRYISTPWGIVRSVGPNMAGCTREYVSLAPIDTFYWKGATEQFWPQEWALGDEYEFEARFLPFEYYEWQPAPVLVPTADKSIAEAVGYHYGEPCYVAVFIFGDLLPDVPATYLMPWPEPDGGYPTEPPPPEMYTPAGMPHGGNLLESEFQQGDPLGVGPHPLYLVSQDVFEGLREQIQASLAAGVELRMRRALVRTCSP
jgi:hypothetical protein